MKGSTVLKSAIGLCILFWTVFLFGNDVVELTVKIFKMCGEQYEVGPWRFIAVYTFIDLIFIFILMIVMETIDFINDNMYCYDFLTENRWFHIFLLITGPIGWVVGTILLLIEAVKGWKKLMNWADKKLTL